MAEERELKWYGWGVAGKEYDLSRRNNFWPYLTERLQLTGNEKSLPVNIEDIRLPPSDIANVAAKLDTMLGSSGVRDDDFARITHSMGKSYYDLIRIRRGLIDHPPDIVVYPQTITQVLAILQFAAEKQIALIPFGGGTSVVGGVEAIRGNSHTAAISLDMSCLNKVLEVDPVSMLATIEAGIRGPALEAELQKRGFTLGHYPQSFEFSTLGGWVATRSAGQQSNRY
ncbi:MAG: FAD-dependent oxidoreductase, partial [Blastocatellia bacterium]|nr:FAD-dependent oxidoreductase [Blastocatellia bacterium]